VDFFDAYLFSPHLTVPYAKNIPKSPNRKKRWLAFAIKIGAIIKSENSAMRIAAENAITVFSRSIFGMIMASKNAKKGMAQSVK
jgi:hypothetical protein